MSGFGEPEVATLRTPRVVSVNVGEPRTIEVRGHEVTTSIWKSPVSGRVAVRGVNLAGDDQSDRRVHGGPDKAVYAYALEDYGWWETELGRSLAPGTFGENLTTTGVNLSAAVIGERWRVGSAVFEVSQPRFPCFKLGIRMDDAGFVARFDDARRSGAYLRIVGEGDIEAGDDVTVLSRPDHGYTIADIVAVNAEPTPAGLERLVAVPDIPETLRTWAGRRLRRSTAAG